MPRRCASVGLLFDKDHVQKAIDGLDVSSTFEIAFLGGHPKMWLDIDALGEKKYTGDSYMYRTRLDGVVAATHLSDMDIEIYLRSGERAFLSLGPEQSSAHQVAAGAPPGS